MPFLNQAPSICVPSLKIRRFFYLKPNQVQPESQIPASFFAHLSQPCTPPRPCLTLPACPHYPLVPIPSLRPRYPNATLKPFCISRPAPLAPHVIVSVPICPVRISVPAFPPVPTHADPTLPAPIHPRPQKPTPFMSFAHPFNGYVINTAKLTRHRHDPPNLSLSLSLTRPASCQFTLTVLYYPRSISSSSLALGAAILRAFFIPPHLTLPVRHAILPPYHPV